MHSTTAKLRGKKSRRRKRHARRPVPVGSFCCENRSTTTKQNRGVEDRRTRGEQRQAKKNRKRKSKEKHRTNTKPKKKQEVLLTYKKASSSWFF